MSVFAGLFGSGNQGFIVAHGVLRQKTDRLRWRLLQRLTQNGSDQVEADTKIHHNEAAIFGIIARSREMNWVLTRAPVSKTSSAERVAPVIPAAMFVTQEIPRTRIPECRAARTSGTVDMPTKSAPRVRNARISAGVS